MSSIMVEVAFFSSSFEEVSISFISLKTILSSVAVISSESMLLGKESVALAESLSKEVRSRVRFSEFS